MKKKISIVAFLVIIVSFLHCKRSTIFNSNNLRPIDSLVFNTKMNFRPKHFDLLGDTSIYFADVMSAKKIEIFKINGEKEHTIKLDSIVTKINTIDFEIVSIDTILFIDSYNNIIAHVNFNGDIKQITNIEWEDDNIFEIATSKYSSTLLGKDKLLLYLDWRDAKNKPENLSEIEYLEYFYKNVWNSPKLAKISNIFNERKNVTIEKNFSLYKHLFPDDSVKAFLELENYYHNDNIIVIFSSYSNKIIRLNTDLEFIDEHIVEIENTKIGIDLLPVWQISKINNIAKTSTMIDRVFWDKYRKKYYVVVLNEISLPFWEQYRYRPWTLLIFDDEFNKINEIKFLNNKYSSGHLLITEKGTAIMRNKNNNNNEKTIFDIFDF